MRLRSGYRPPCVTPNTRRHQTSETRRTATYHSRETVQTTGASSARPLRIHSKFFSRQQFKTPSITLKKGRTGFPRIATLSYNCRPFDEYPNDSVAIGHEEMDASVGLVNRSVNIDET